MGSHLRIPKICHFCGNDFTARRTNTKYCSHKCASDANKECKREVALFNLSNEVEINPNSIQPPILNHKDILSITEAAEYMGIGKSTVHRYCVSKQLKCVRINRKIFIRKSDIHTIFDTAEDYEVAKRQPRKPITEFYTSREIGEKYNCCKDAAIRLCRSHKIPTIKRGQFYYFSKEHVDRLYALRQPDPEISEWYLTTEIMKKYSVGKNAVYSLTSENAVPKKNDKGRTLYSKKHIDALLSQRDISEVDHAKWYTVPEIMSKYDRPKGWVAHFVYKKGITKTKRGTVSYYLKEEFDAEYVKAYPPQEWYWVEEVMEKYGLSRDSIYGFIKRYTIPTEKQGAKIRISKNHIDKYFDYSFL